jgi:hypothetical protein
MLVAVAYLIYYANARSIGADTGSDRLTMLAQFSRTLPLYLSVWMLGVPINLLIAAPDLITWTMGICAIIVAILLIRRIGRISQDRVFFASWAACFLAMALLTNPEVRALSIATVGWSYVLASFLLGSDVEPQPESRFLLLRHWLFTANFGISIACAIGIVLYSNHAERSAQAAIHGYLDHIGAPLKEGDVVIVGEPDSNLEIIAAGDRLEMISGARNVSLIYLMLHNATGGARLVSENMITTGASVGPLIDAQTLRLAMGRDYEPRVGDHFATNLFDAKVDSVFNGEIWEMSFRFHRPLTDSAMHLIRVAAPTSARRE